VQETRPPEGPNLREAFAGTPEAMEKQMNERLAELPDHELVQRTSISMPQALVLEIERCEYLLGKGTRMNQAALRSAINEARDSILKFEHLQKRVVRSFERLKDFK